MDRFLEKLGQQHLYKWMDASNTLKEQVAQFDLVQLEKLIQQEKPKASSQKLEGVSVIKETSENSNKEAYDYIKTGKLGLVTVAGGQGSRLGFDGPKGCFKASPIAKLSLFEIFSQKILASQKRYGVEIPWALMTSQANHQQTVAFFEENGFFGLKPNQVRFFIQGMLPAVDAQSGKILLANKDSMALSPDGHGGLLKALTKSGTLGWLKEQGIQTLSYFQVDNPLVKVIDSAFLAVHLEAQSEFSSKSVQKRSWDEKVGVFAKTDKGIGLVEYSDLTQQQAQATHNGELLLSEANIAVHLLEINFIEELAKKDSLPYHRAHKKVAYISKDGILQTPEQPNAIKFEQFIFDALTFAKNPIIFRTQREEEFSPIKNKEGFDSVESSQADQLALWKRWVEAAGQPIPEFEFEITPAYADSQEAFIEQFRQNPIGITPQMVL